MTPQWRVSECGRAVFALAPFGAGPVVAAETLAAELGFDCPLRVFDGTSRDNCILFNFGVPDLPSSRGTPEIWIDCLGWAREGWPAAALRADARLPERFFPTGHASNEVSYYEIAPLVGRLPSTPGRTGRRSGVTIVSFGGLHTPFFGQQQYIPALAGLVVALSTAISRRDAGGESIVCCVPADLHSAFSKMLSFDSRVSASSPSYGRYLEMLLQCDLAVIQPGLYGPIEAFAMGIPMLFSPPMSFTQAIQARAFKESGVMTGIVQPVGLAHINELTGGYSQNREVGYFEDLSRELTPRRSVREWAEVFSEWSVAATSSDEPWLRLDVRQRFASGMLCLTPARTVLVELGLWEGCASG